MTLDDLYRLLRSSHVQAQGVVDTIDEPLVVLDPSLTVLTANPAFLRDFHTDRDRTEGFELFKLGNGQWDIPEFRQLLSQVLPRATAIIDYEVSHDFPEIGPRTFLVTARRLVHPDDNSQKILVMFNDVTRRRRHDEAMEVVLNETRHRMKNLMALIRALAHQTRVEGLTAAEYREAFLGRLQGLLVAQELTLAEAGHVELETLVERVLQPYTDRMKIEPGPAVKLAGHQVQPLGMVLHELATNAVKYGSLSVPDGGVRLSWSNDARRLSLAWVEEGGPPVSRPSREGFGARLIRHTAADLQGEVRLAYERDGLRAGLEFPIEYGGA